MRTKTAKAIQLMQDGETAKALSIFKTFKIGFDKEERRIIQIASESMNGFGKFYIKLGYDVEKFQAKAIAIVKEKYNIQANPLG